MSSGHWRERLAKARLELIGEGQYGQVFRIVGTEFVLKRQRMLQHEDQDRALSSELRVYRTLTRGLRRDALQRQLVCLPVFSRLFRPCGYSSLPEPASNEFLDALARSSVCAEFVFPLHGRSLHAWLSSSPARAATVLCVCRQIAALHLVMYAHNVFHNDLHSDNVLVSELDPSVARPVPWAGASYTPRMAKGCPVLVAIDFGLATVGTHFHDPELYLLHEMRYSIVGTILHSSRMYTDDEHAGSTSPAPGHDLVRFVNQRLPGFVDSLAGKVRSRALAEALRQIAREPTAPRGGGGGSVAQRMALHHMRDLLVAEHPGVYAEYAAQRSSAPGSDSFAEYLTDPSASRVSVGVARMSRIARAANVAALLEALE